MSRQMKGWSPPKYGVPAASKFPDVEFTQACNLDVECLPVRNCRTTPLPRDDHVWIFAASLLIGIFRQKNIPLDASARDPANLAQYMVQGGFLLLSHRSDTA